MIRSFHLIKSCKNLHPTGAGEHRMDPSEEALCRVLSSGSSLASREIHKFRDHV